MLCQTLLLVIDIGSGLIYYEYFVVPEHGSGQTDELFLTHTKVISSFTDHT